MAKTILFWIIKMDDRVQYTIEMTYGTQEGGIDNVDPDKYSHFEMLNNAYKLFNIKADFVELIIGYFHLVLSRCGISPKVQSLTTCEVEDDSVGLSGNGIDVTEEQMGTQSQPHRKGKEPETTHILRHKFRGKRDKAANIIAKNCDEKDTSDDCEFSLTNDEENPSTNVREVAAEDLDDSSEYEDDDVVDGNDSDELSGLGSDVENRLESNDKEELVQQTGRKRPKLKVEARYYIDPSDLDPCAKSENKYPECANKKEKYREKAKYNRGYVAINRYHRNGKFRG
ncbi:hypothetical protein JCGZ_15321 [Jatropha curcas]|uniref:Uncharacterized protein n=1 Tax=Jatropha curcas TaxID=180498 RepID=A0A067LBV7_JATCU|nr:hypothetical protein JCGZ_15321 [Jatropha curcas]